jgi:AraC-like DNA-binding protein
MVLIANILSSRGSISEVLHAVERFGNLIRCAMRTAKTLQPGTSYRLRAAHSFIRSHYTDPTLDLLTVARAVGLSAAHLSRLFSREGGVSFRVFVRGVRMEQAVILLKDPRLRIKEIAVIVGCSCTAALDRDFRACYKMSPSEFRLAL